MNERRSKIEQIKRILTKAAREKKTIIEEQLICELCLRWSTTRRTIREYIYLLEKSDFCDRDKGLGWIWLKQKEEIIKEDVNAFFDELKTQSIEENNKNGAKEIR